MLLNLVQSVDNVALHRLRHHDFHGMKNLVELTPHIGDFVLVVPVPIPAFTEPA
jgi:hypothetical protein